MSTRHVVTGAAGLVGYEYAARALEAGDEVLAVDHGRKGGMEDLAALARQHPGRLEILPIDLAREPLPALGRVDVVAHFAAVLGVRHVEQHPWETIEVNLRSTLAVIEAAGAARAKAFLFASSSENYAFAVERGWAPLPTPEDVPIGIADPALPRWSYAASKIAGESAVFSAARVFGFAPVVVRLHNVYGPRMPPTHVVPELLERCARRDDPFPVLGPEQTRCFLHAQDAGRAILLVARAGLERGGGIWNVGWDEEVRMGELAEMCLRISGHRPHVEVRPAPQGSVPRRQPDIAKLRDLGFSPTIGLEAGVAGCWQRLRARNGAH